MATQGHYNPNRRHFIRTSGGVLAAAALAGQARTAFAADGGETLRVGLIGCGGRGSGAAREALLADPNTKLVAMGDTFMDRVESSLKKFVGSDVDKQVAVDKDHMFSGFDAYKKVIENCDVVVLATPPAFRPEHLRAAVEAGKHVFCEKPVAVDGAGVRHVLESCKMAEAKGLCVVSGLCYRYQFAKQETVNKLIGGAIGDIMVFQTTYNTGALWHHGRKDDWSEMEYQVRNWLYFDWLSGDHINEQHIHSLDKVGWAMNNVYPIKATSSGGRVQRTDPKFGNIYDHFNTVYEWENGTKAFSSCRQWDNASTDVSDWVYGTKGKANIQTHEIWGHDGATWKHEQTTEDNMYQNEHNVLFAAIRKGEPINNGEYMCGSTLMAIMGRLAAYTGKTLTRDEVLNAKESLVPQTLAWGDAPQRAVAQPGVYELA
ncbi:MAG: Gfo/Idh/MocA family oxidoreductase [Candidatus Hydrogenedentes bacterium]|nr:Gfo/Idh/MocA family oxidoreductase [Candidatus Hydrogenedentota bacterium]